MSIAIGTAAAASLWGACGILTAKNFTESCVSRMAQKVFSHHEEVNSIKGYPINADDTFQLGDKAVFLGDVYCACARKSVDPVTHFLYEGGRVNEGFNNILIKKDDYNALPIHQKVIRVLAVTLSGTVVGSLHAALFGAGALLIGGNAGLIAFASLSLIGATYGTYKGLTYTPCIEQAWEVIYNLVT